MKSKPAEGGEHSVRTSVFLPESLVKRIDRLANQDCRNRSNFLAAYLPALLDRVEKEWHAHGPVAPGPLRLAEEPNPYLESNGTEHPNA